MIEYGLLSDRPGHSWRRTIHNMLADYRYELYAVTPDALNDIMTARAFKGLNVAAPYERAVMPYCDEIAVEADEAGGVDTLVMGADGKLRGYNAGLFGFLSLAGRAGVALAGKKVVILGAGDGSRTVQAACRRAGARETVVSLGGPADDAALQRDHADAEVIVNARPAGTDASDGQPRVQLDRFPRCEGVLDVNCTPLRTGLLLDARARDIPCAGGLWMLAAQAKQTAEYFTGRLIGDDEMRRVYVALRARMANLVLIGMPGCGKSAVGRAAARAMGRRFVDLDAAIEREAGMSVPDIFAREGEAGFRGRERAAAARYGREQSLVIAAGGGAVTRADTMRALRQNGEALWLRRPVEWLATAGRPLSPDRETVKRMEAERAPLYEAYSAAKIDNTGSVEQAARRAIEAFYEAVDRLA